MQDTMTAGALAGLAATVPMTMTMAVLRRYPRYDPTPLPPQRVAKSVTHKLDIDKDMDRAERSTFTWLMHFGIGAAGGCTYTLLTDHPERRPILKGISFGLGVWASSYVGGLPALGILRFPTKNSKQHVASQVLSHVVWGAALGALASRLSSARGISLAR